MGITAFHFGVDIMRDIFLRTGFDVTGAEDTYEEKLQHVVYFLFMVLRLVCWEDCTQQINLHASGHKIKRQHYHSHSIFSRVLIMPAILLCNSTVVTQLLTNEIKC